MFWPPNACWQLRKSQNAVLYIAANGKIVMGVGVRRFTEITGITEITTEITEITTEITEITTEITIESTKVWINGVYDTTIYYCKLYFNICLHDFVIKQIYYFYSYEY